ncbi:S1/P1 nuclease [uncultured Alistipes sp.]|nr:S1/P1 nuclease [uncultured Alistipes sp.]
MKQLKFILLAIMLFMAGTCYSWDRTRHDAIAYIAECNLTPKAKKNIAKYLEYSIVYYASFMDKYRNTPEYCNIEHVAYVDADMRHIDKPRKGKTDCVTELMRAIDRLKDYKNMSDSLVRLNLMYLIHIAGDMHCPAHVKYPGVKSGRAEVNGTKMSYHAAWDWGILQAAHGWSYTEYGQILDNLSKKQQAAICRGTPQEWLHQTALDCRVIYDWQREDGVYDKQFVLDTYLLAERQLIKAAYRLAAVLNDLFG